jgi:hypothetical protein
MPRYLVTATMYTDLHMDIEASNPTEASEKAEALDGGDWIENHGWEAGDFKIDAVFVYQKDGDLRDVSKDVEEGCQISGAPSAEGEAW